MDNRAEARKRMETADVSWHSSLGNQCNREMHRHTQNLQINEMRTIPDLRSPKRGEGKRVFNMKMSNR